MSGALSVLGTIQSSIGAVGALSNAVDALAGGFLGSGFYEGVSSGLGEWAYGLQTASWRGLPFVVRESQVRRGRRTVVHEYPYRDDVWVEDLGRGTRVTTFRGYIVGDDVYLQEQAFVAAAERSGPGTLVHPSLGARTATLVQFGAAQSAERGRIVELEFEFVEQSSQLFPSSALSTPDATLMSADDADAASSSDFLGDAGAAIASGAQAVQQASATVGAWAGVARSLVGDATMGARAVAGLAGNFGRYAGGARSARLLPSSSLGAALSAVTEGRTLVAATGSAAMTVASLL